MGDQTSIPVSRLVEDFQRLRRLGRQRALTVAEETALVVLRCALTELLARPPDDDGGSVTGEEAADKAATNGPCGARPGSVGADAGRS